LTSLLSAPGYRLHREQVSDWLWPEAEPAAAVRNLHATLHLLRGVLDDPSTTTSALRLVGEMVVLEPAGGAPPAVDWLDAAAFARAARGPDRRQPGGLPGRAGALRRRLSARRTLRRVGDHPARGVARMLSGAAIAPRTVE